MYAVELTFTLLSSASAPSVEVLEEAIRRTRLIDGRVEHVHAAPVEGGFCAVVFLATRNEAEAGILGLLSGAAAAAGITAIEFDGCKSWPPGSNGGLDVRGDPP
jgi:hypothetical protein